MTDIPEDIMKLAKSLAVDGFADYFNAPQKIAAALMGDRKRCAEIARTWDDDPYVGSAIAEVIMEGGKA